MERWQNACLGAEGLGKQCSSVTARFCVFISSEMGVRLRMVGKKLPCFFLPRVLELCATFQ